MCVGGETGVQPCFGSIEGEDATDFDGEVESTNAGYVGEGYFNTTNAVGTYGSWIIYADEALTADLTFRYANGSSEERAVSVSVNGSAQLASVSMPTTSAWTSWSSVTVSIEFVQGENVITLTSLTEDGSANIDVITYGSDALNTTPSGVKVNPHLNKKTALAVVNNKVSFCSA